MDVYEARTHSFVVKVWLEEVDVGGGSATWRGYITHVPSNQRRYITDLDSISAFIAPYLDELQVRLNVRWEPKQK